MKRVRVEISEGMKDEARKHAQAIVDKYHTVGDYGLGEQDRFYNGMLGEQVFKQFLDERGVGYCYEHRHDGTDKGDFQLEQPDRIIDVDVKTCSKPSYKKLMMPETQYRNSSYDAYIGVQLIDEDTAEIHGWCNKEDLQPDTSGTVKIPTRQVSLSQLKDIEKLLATII